MSVRIIALAAMVEIRGISTCFEFMGAVQSYPTPYSEPPVKLSPITRVLVTRGEPLFSSPFPSLSLSYPLRVTGDLCESRYSSVIARVPNLERYISGAKKKYVRIRREESRGVEILSRGGGRKRTPRLDPLSGYASPCDP